MHSTGGFIVVESDQRETQWSKRKILANLERVLKPGLSAGKPVWRVKLHRVGDRGVGKASSAVAELQECRM